MAGRRVDRNQSEIVSALRAIGATVHCTHELGKGFPDLVVLFKDRVSLLEVKDWQKKPSEQRLTEDEAVFHKQWVGHVFTVKTVDEAYDAIGAPVWKPKKS